MFESMASVIAIAELAACQLGIKVIQVKPQMVKASVCGSGKASKAQVVKMANRILKTEIKNNHTSDAAAVAIAGLLMPE